MWYIVRLLARGFSMDVWKITRRELELAQPPRRSASVATEFVRLGDDEIHALSAHHPEMSAAFVSEALSRGDQCLAARQQDEIVGLTWRSSAYVRVSPGLDLHLLRPHTFVGFKSWVDPRARGQSLFGAMRYAFDKESTEHGLTEGISYVHVDNAPSLKSIGGDPAVKKIGWVIHAKWGPASWAVASSGARPWLSLTVHRTNLSE